MEYATPESERDVESESGEEDKESESDDESQSSEVDRKSNNEPDGGKETERDSENLICDHCGKHTSLYGNYNV
jgi:hypothetical protein